MFDTKEAVMTHEDPQSLESQAAVVALLRTREKGQSWSGVADRVLEERSALAVWMEGDDALIGDPRRSHALDEAIADLRIWSSRGWHFVSILDGQYPSRLRDIHQAPPFVFACGELRTRDLAVAVVGSRKASTAGLSFAAEVAAGLVAADVTVLSGLADGIDGAAHTAALAAGGRTVAVIGTGVAKAYPAVNKDLQAEIVRRGLVLSQFWPDAPPQRHNFLMRNAVMSGYGYGTVVVEAGEQSGARAQARMAVEHGRPVILSQMVVDRNEWAKRLVGRPGVHIAATPDQVLVTVQQILEDEHRLDGLLRQLVGSDG